MDLGLPPLLTATGPYSDIIWAFAVGGCDAGHGRLIPSDALVWHFAPNLALGTKAARPLVMLGAPLFLRRCRAARGD